jgi:hypothetical protein
MLAARHRLGASVVAASAGSLAIGALTIPVYEVFKVGEEIHWKPGLDLFGPFGLSLVFVPHWNNTDGGAHLDTSRCFMGRSRFDEMLEMLPTETVVVGIEEHTGLIVDLAGRSCQVRGRGGVILLRDGQEHRFDQGQSFAIAELGPYRELEPSVGIPGHVWERTLAAVEEQEDAATRPPPAEVVALLEEREIARVRQDWGTADQLRDQIRLRGWNVQDTPSGPRLAPIQD